LPRTERGISKIFSFKIRAVLAISMFFFVPFKTHVLEPAPVAHACNPSYSGGRQQEDHVLRPAWANSLGNPISKNPSQKKAGGVAKE
jgi:hypothetical protein